MNRIFYTILLLLLLITGGVLLWQWDIYSENKSNADLQTFQPNETIHLSVTDQNINIHHEIEGLPAGNYVLQNIKNKPISCQEDKKNCEIANKDQLETAGGIITLTYSLKKSKASAYLLNDWAVQIKDVGMSQTQEQRILYK